MLKHILIFCAFLAVTSCTKESGSITGSWVTEIPDQPQHKRGFTLKDDGRASSINLESKLYERWEKQGDLLILSGKNEFTERTDDVTDTMKIISAGDSTLVVEHAGKRFTYTKTGNPDKLISDFELYECFVYKSRKDSAFLHVNVADSIVTGELFYAFYEKDRNQGKIDGVMRGDTIYAKYTFVSEGTESTREVVFLKKGPQWIEGFGEVEDRDGSMVFKDRSKLKFRRGLAFKGIRCPPTLQ
ncbi:lipocalin family protein [Dyadobacter sp.]|uniref:lipocalin family protein n=1 Tax=Dyadobacter sp. TaxID=1914288 RepID=UPI003F7090F9